MICRTLSLVLLVASGSLARGETFVYISVAAEKRIAVYQLDSATGILTHKSDCQVTDGEPGALHAEKFYRTSSEEFTLLRPAFRWRQIIALARVTASEFGYADARRLLNV